MTVTAKLRYLRIAPRKVRLVADLIRGKSVMEAKTVLSFQIKRASNPVYKLLQSAAANAKNNFNLDENNLYISRITVDEGPKFKRWRPRARGRAYPIQKKTSHITLILDENPKKKNSIKEKSSKIESKPAARKAAPKLLKLKKAKR